MAIYGYTKNYKLIKPKYDTDTWHDYEYDNLDTIDAVLSAIYASGDWQGFWKSNTHYNVGDIVIDRDTDTMYKVMVEHTTSAGSFAAEWTAHHNYYELWSPNDLAESWATKTDGKVSDTDYSSKAYAVSSGLINDGSAKEWAVGSGAIGNTNEYSAKKYATDAHNDYISMTTNPNVAAVGSNINNVNAVGQSISNVNTVATNISDVNTAAANISTIRYAPTAANNAAQYANNASSDARASGRSATASANSANASATSANNSHIWAEGTDAQVQALGGVHSSKGWAEQSTNANIALTNSPYTTNRILEIPQDIKLELNNGTLTLKAGSKVYVPNGFESDGTTPKFDVVTIASDIVYNTVTDTTGTTLFFLYSNLGIGAFTGPDNAKVNYYFSGNTVPTVTSTYALWYDTANNIVKNTFDNGATWVSGDTLPIAICSYTNGIGVTSIDQVFNGFGYIGSTVFALPGVKVQGAFGVNEDGTYKLKTFITDRVLTNSFDSTVYDRYEFGFDVIENGTITYFGAYAEEIKVGEKQPSGVNFSWWNPIKGETRYVDLSGIAENTLHCSTRLGRINVSEGKIVSMTRNPTDSIVTSNASNFSQAGRSYLSGLGMPSSRYIDLTLGASGSTYTAPANGWLFLMKEVATSSQNIHFICNGREDIVWGSGAGNVNIILLFPVSLGDVVKITYSAEGPTKAFRFIYAKGDQ